MQQAAKVLENALTGVAKTAPANGRKVAYPTFEEYRARGYSRQFARQMVRFGKKFKLREDRGDHDERNTREGKLPPRYNVTRAPYHVKRGRYGYGMIEGGGWEKGGGGGHHIARYAG